MTRLRWWLAVVTLVLGAAAALVREPARVAAPAPSSVYKPPSGC